MSEELNEIEEVDTDEVQEEVKTYDFPNTTVFYQELKEKDGVKWLCGTVTNAALADQLGFLNNHYDFSELTLIKGIFYLKGYEKPDQSEQELIEQKIEEIDSQLEQYMDNKVHVDKDYMNIVSCISYFNSTDDEFRSDARAALRWRDDIYKVGREVRDKVRAGELDWHEIDMQYILDRVDPLEW